MLSAQQVLEKYIKFFKEKGHKQIPNVPLVPENDPTLLFVNSGMFPLVPYLSGEPHPLGKRLMNIQRCVRFSDDIDEVGKTIRHTLAFHQLGNWSLGDYFKKEQLEWLYEFVIEELKLDPQNIYASVFSGDEDAPKDEETLEILTNIFEKYDVDPAGRIFFYGKDENWWQRGDGIGELGGPDSEIFYFIGGDVANKNPQDNEEEFIELGNSVFMQYKKTKDGWEDLPQKNIDFGGGYERFVMFAQKKSDIFETDLYKPILEKIQEISGLKYDKDMETKVNMRILADHIKACILLTMDGVIPSNKDQGYILRQIIRRMLRVGKKLGVENITTNLLGITIKTYTWMYPELPDKQERIEQLLVEEEKKFNKVLTNGARVVRKKLKSLNDEQKKDPNFLAHVAFDIYQSVGYPWELFLEDLKDQGIVVKENLKEFRQIFLTDFDLHQELSRKGSEQKFKGGLAEHNEINTQYHTTTHLLQWALREVLGEHVQQEGSNITNERLRFDFSHKDKLSDEQISKVTTLVNETIRENLPVNFEVLAKKEAIELGALYLENKEYEDPVKVYYVGKNLEDAKSMELCGGPHVKNTKELLPIEIYKQDKIGEGKMRVYARFK